MPKIHQNTSGGRSTPGLAGGAYALPQFSQPQWGHTSKGRREGKAVCFYKGDGGEGKEERGKGKRR